MVHVRSVSLCLCLFTFTPCVNDVDVVVYVSSTFLPSSVPSSIKGAEARRRITFFVNSLLVEQPQKRRVLQMPSLTTLTPYYNEDVVSSMA